MRCSYNQAIFIFFINWSINPILSLHNENNINFNNQDKNNKFYREVITIANNKSKDEKFNLKEIPKFNIEELKNTVKSDKDPFKDIFSSNGNSSFDNLYIELLGLFNVNGEKNAMFRTNDGVKNYLIDDVIDENYQIKDINLSKKEVLITDGKETKIYKFPKR